MSQYWIEDGQTLLFIGDSITDCGRRGAEAPLGNGDVRLHDIFQRQLQYRDADTFCPEPVHPNQAGHLVIAQALMDALTA